MGKILALAAVFILLISLMVILPVFFSLIIKPSQPVDVPPEQNPPAAIPKPPPPIVPPPILSKPTPSEIAPPPAYNLSAMELEIHALVNEQRAQYGLGPLKYNPDLANVARDHSIDLAQENEPLTDPKIYCHEIFIHHEGFDFGLYETDRLLNRTIYYFDVAGENIFMTSTWNELLPSDPGLAPCIGELQIVEVYDDPDQVMEDYETLLEHAERAKRTNWTSAKWLSEDGIGETVVDGWMKSPGHRANILESRFDEEGIGIAKVNDFIIVTEVLIRRAECGYPDAKCCEDESGFYCYEPWDCRGKTCR